MIVAMMRMARPAKSPINFIFELPPKTRWKSRMVMGLRHFVLIPSQNFPERSWTARKERKI